MRFFSSLSLLIPKKIVFGDEMRFDAGAINPLIPRAPNLLLNII
jgi:hypothetical protein